MIKQINTKNAPGAIGPYSQAIEANGFLFCSGQIGLDPETGELRPGIEIQTKQVLENLKAIVEAAGLSLENVLKTTIYLKNLSDFQTVNEIYGKFFDPYKPARVTIEVSGLPKGALIEIDLIAAVND